MPETIEAPAEVKTPEAKIDTTAPETGWDDLDASIFASDEPDKQPDKPDGKEPEKKTDDPAKKEDTVKKEEVAIEGKVPDKKPEAKPAEGPKALREELERIKKEHATILAERDEFKTKFPELEKSAKEKSAIAEEAAALKKEREELVRQVEMLKFEESPTFKQQYDKPWKQAIATAQADIKELKVIVGRDEDTGEVQTRPATWDDFSALWGMSRVGARNAARKLFGEDYDVAVKHYDHLQEMDGKAKQAISEHRETYETKQKSEAAEAARTREAIESTWSKVNDDIKSKRPEWFGEDANDKEGNKLLAEGYKMVDAAYGDRADQTWQQRVVLDANIRHRAAAFPRLAHKLTKATAEIEALKKQVAEFENSAPGGGRKAGKTEGQDDDFEDLLREALPG